MLLLKPEVWFFIALTVFCICTGGIVYSIIHGMPWFKFDRDEFGKVYVSEYFMKGQRGQWAGEGYIVSFLTLFDGITLILLSRVHLITDKPMKQRIIIFGSIIAVFILNELILLCYRFKSPWYGPTFYPPAHYNTGPLIRDQGNNI